MSLLKSVKLFSLTKVTSCSTVRMAHWNKDFKPGPYPKTEAERAAAAKKYGLLKEEYEPAPDDGFGIGDYPNIPPISAESRDIYYPWDFPEYRRNFGECLHPTAHLYGEDRYHVLRKPRYSMTYMFTCFFSVMGTVYFLAWLGQDACFMPVMPKQLPGPDVKHYKY